MSIPYIETNPADCRDCYRCVRNCSVKAIRFKNGQAQVVPKLCIVCGMCIRVCPQKAKSIHSAAEDVLKAKNENRRLIASVAPSAPAFFHMKNFVEMEDALKRLGFHAAEETVVGANIVGLAHQKYADTHQDCWPVITSSCPAIINLIEKYYPDLIPHLAPLVSPMIAHGRMLAQKYGPDAYIVFIGPCLAKKMEIHDKPVAGVVHAAMTFSELEEWFTAAMQERPAVDIVKTQPADKARLFPLEGGLIGMKPMNAITLDRDMVVASGLDDCQDVLLDIRAGRVNKKLVELMACKGGCVSSTAAANPQKGNNVSGRNMEGSDTGHEPALIPIEIWPSLERTFRDRSIQMPEFSEEQIQEVMQLVNKYNSVDELNCGACGYATCREKAIATLRGMAEATMCIPYMRHRSEFLHRFVMDVAPNAIIIIDDNLTIHDLSPSAEKLFKHSLSDVHGKHLSCLLSVLDDFEYVRDTGIHIVGQTRQLREGLIVEQTIGRVAGQPLMVAILRDVTEREKSYVIREEMLEKTREVVRKQMRVAHEIAHMLGETAAESNTTLINLTKLIKEQVSSGKY